MPLQPVLPPTRVPRGCPAAFGVLRGGARLEAIAVILQLVAEGGSLLPIWLTTAKVAKAGRERCRLRVSGERW